MLGLVGVGFGAIGPVSSIQSGFLNAINGLINIGTFFGTTANTLQSLQTSLQDTQSAADDLVAVLQGYPGGGSIATDLQNNLYPVINTATSAVQDGVPVFQGLQSNLERIPDTFNTQDYTQKFASQIPYAMASLFGAISFIFLLTLIPMAWCRFVHRPVTGIILLLGALLWVLAGALLAAGIGAADICFDPASTLTTAAAQAGEPNLSETVNYFVTCTATTPLPSALNAVSQAQSATVQINSTFASAYAQIRQSFSGQQDVMSRADSVQNSVHGVLGDVNSVFGLLTCAAIKPLWIGVVSPVCNTLIGDGLIPYWACLTSAGILLVFALISNMALCYRHPGQPEDPEGRGDIINPLTSSDSTRPKYGADDPLVKDV
jgi:hypothetical protein